MTKIGIVHYTLPPQIGGVERIIEAQARALLAQRHAVHLIGGAGAGIEDAGRTLIPEMLPQHPTSVSWRRQFDSPSPPESDVQVLALTQALGDAIDGCDTVCIHNALTVNLNPLLSRALVDLIRDSPAVHWSIWCADISQNSAYASSTQAPGNDMRELIQRSVNVVAISEFRARELCSLFQIPLTAIEIVPPPLDLRWMGIGEECLRLVSSLDLLNADPLVLVPSKSLPHKRLDRCLDLAGSLVSSFEHPLVLVTGAPSPHEPDVSAHVLESMRTAASRSGGIPCSVASTKLGHAPSDRTVRDLMLLADVVYLPSAEEGYGLPILEAAALRTPVVASDIPAFRESGEGWATYVSRDASADAVAAAVGEAWAGQGGVARKRALRSSEVFRRDVLRLLDSPSLNE